MSHILLMLTVMCALPAAGGVPAAYPQAQEQDLDQGAANLGINVQEVDEVDTMYVFMEKIGSWRE